MALKRVSNYLGRFWTGTEAAYGVIIAMTFTSTLRGLSDITWQELYSTVVFTALFCCIAWGIADGFFYGWERNFNTRMQEKIVESARSSEDKKKDLAISLLHEELDDSIMGTFDAPVRQRIYERIVEYLSETEVDVK
ncbi:MAG TPA: hypothetical protein VFF30_01385 [Nitrososphaerales archaeon]|nr:hypothetical protein [Nitrososphaerales archaeon]